MRFGPAQLWFRADISYPQFSRDLLWGVTDIEYYGGSTDQRIRFAENRKLLHGPFYFAEQGSAAPCEVVPMLLDGMSFSNRSDRKVRAMEGRF